MHVVTYVVIYLGENKIRMSKVDNEIKGRLALITGASGGYENGGNQNTSSFGLLTA